MIAAIPQILLPRNWASLVALVIAHKMFTLENWVIVAINAMLNPDGATTFILIMI